MCEVNVELAGDAQAFVDLEGAVYVRVVDEALPADCCAGFFEVGAHYEEEVGGVFGLEGEETGGVFFCGDGVVDGTWSDYDYESV